MSKVQLLRESLSTVAVRNGIAPRMKPFESQLKSATALHRESLEGSHEEIPGDLEINGKGRLKRNSIRRSGGASPTLSSIGGRIQRPTIVHLDDQLGGSVVASMSATARARRERIPHQEHSEEKKVFNPSSLSIPLDQVNDMQKDSTVIEKESNVDDGETSSSSFIVPMVGILGIGGLASASLFF